MVGIITRSTESIVIDDHGLFKCTRVQKAPPESACDPKCQEYAYCSYDQFINAGAKSSDVRVRPHVAGE